MSDIDIEGFDLYSEARKAGFFKAQTLKRAGGTLVGIFCTYTPVELIHAAGALSVSLCGTSEEAIPDAEKHLPRNLCPLIKSSYGFAVSDRCPYFYFSDLVVGETTCDGKKKMFELLGKLKPVYVLSLPPRGDGEAALAYWVAELHSFRKYLEGFFGREISDDTLRAEIRRSNDERRALMDFFELGRLNPSPIKGTEMGAITESLGFQFDREAQLRVIREKTAEYKMRYQTESAGKPTRPRMLVSGCPTGGVRQKVLAAIEEAGADIVCFENCSGVREKQNLVKEDGDPMEALARKYLAVSCSVMSPNPARLKALDGLIDEYRADGVIEIVLQACHTFNVEAHAIKSFVQDTKHMPYLFLETDYSPHDAGQIRTRVEAFVEMLRA